MATKVRSSTQLNIDANLDAQTHKIINVVDPVNPQDAASKNYVDTRPSLTIANFVFSEVPAGTVNGVNAAFTLVSTPTAGTLRVHLNGLRQALTTDYTLSTNTITFVAAPLTGDVLSADYMK